MSQDTTDPQSRLTDFQIRSVLLSDGYGISLWSETRFLGEQINLKNKFAAKINTDPLDKSTNCICFDLKLNESDFIPQSSGDMIEFYPELVGA